MDCNKCKYNFKKRRKRYRIGGITPESTRPYVTDKRLNNFYKAFSKFKWDESSLELTVIGYGDRPAFQIDGIFEKYDGSPDIKVRWHSYTPGGGQARIYYWVEDKRYRLDAAQKNAMAVTKRLLRDYHRNLAVLADI